jgi:cell division protein FtsI/penicillin-binding protein 2
VIKVAPERYYPNSIINSHLIGYVREISKEQLTARQQNLDKYQYLPGDKVGKNGIEKTFENISKVTNDKW